MFYATIYKGVIVELSRTDYPESEIKNTSFIELTEEQFNSLVLPCDENFQPCEWGGYDTEDMPEPSPPEPMPEPEPTLESDTLRSIIDQEYRLTLLELGV